MLSQLKKLQVSLNSCNEMSLVVLASLSSSLPHPTSLSPSPPPPPVRITQDIEIWLFDLSTLLQSANLQVNNNRIFSGVKNVLIVPYKIYTYQCFPQD